MKIRFPILLNSDKTLLAWDMEAPKFYRFKLHRDSELSYEVPSKTAEKAEISWMLDSNADMIYFTNSVLLNPWAVKFKGLFAVKKKANLSPPRKVSVDELKADLRGCKGVHAKDLRAFLKSRDPSEGFTRDLFLEFMQEDPNELVEIWP